MKSNFVGIYNQGCTCYLNSVIQALYHLPLFRSEICNLPDVEKDSVTLALRNLFGLLEIKSTSITTKQLTDAFDWNDGEESVQHDVHELTQQLFDSLEKTYKGTQKESFIRDIFGGTMIYRSKAVDGVEYVADRLETMYDMELVVKDKSCIQESLDDFEKGEKIEGVSIEVTPGAPPTPHTIERTQHFLRLPKVLIIHPNRVSFDMQTFNLVTLNNRWTFDFDLDLSPYMIDDSELKLDKESKEKIKKMEHMSSLGPKYRLHSILIHAGNAQMGHYYVYVRCGAEWVRFNDEVVDVASMEDIAKSAFGGQQMTSSYGRLFDMERASLLFYINDDAEQEVLAPRSLPVSATDAAREIEDALTRKMQTRNVDYYVCDESIVDAFDQVTGAAERLKRTAVVHVKGDSATTEEVRDAIARDLGTESAAVRLLPFQMGYGMETLPLTLSRRTGAYVVDLHHGKPEVELDELSAEDAPFVAVVRFLDAAGGRASMVHIMHSRDELCRAIPKPYTLYAYEGYHPMLVGVAAPECVADWSYLIAVPPSLTVRDAQKFLAARKMARTKFCYLNSASGELKEMFECDLEDTTPYSQLQSIIFRAFKGNPLVDPTYTANHIGIYRGWSGGTRRCVLPILPCSPNDLPSSECTLRQLCDDDPSARRLMFSFFPEEVYLLREDVMVILNGGYGKQPPIYITADISSMTLGDLQQVAAAQLKSRMDQPLFEKSKNPLQVEVGSFRLLKMRNGVVHDIYTEKDDVVEFSRGSVFVLDPLAPTFPGMQRVDVVFWDRRSGDQQFGFPTNIGVKSTMDEKGEDLLTRIVRKLCYPSVEEAKKRWILSVKQIQSGKTCTSSKNDTLRAMVDSIGGGPFCFVVDRPKDRHLDALEGDEQRRKEAINIKSSSTTDLSAL